MLPRLALLVLALALLGGRPAIALDASAPLEDMRARALELVNASRAEHNLPALEATEPLATAAQSHAEDLRRRDYFAHVSPEGGTVMDRYMVAGGSRSRAVAENIGACGPCPSRDVIDHLHDGWMNSPDHRENILDPGMERFGFGASGDAERLLAVQTFAGPGTAPPGAEDGETGLDPIPPDERLALAIALVNAQRRDANAPPLKAAPSLGEALDDQVPEDHLEDFGLEGVNVPAGSGEWRRLFVLGGRCGGCGTEVTARDVRFFVGQWLDIPAYRDALLDPAQTHLGLTVSADGSGAKVALAALAWE